MNTIHDMGGMHGFGPIEYEEDEPVFHHEWEGRAYAMVTQTPLDHPLGFREFIESMDPAHYLTSTYYEKWLHLRIEGLFELGTISREELHAQMDRLRENPNDMPSPTEDPTRLQKVLSSIRKPRTHQVESDVKPAFRMGDQVHTRNSHPAGHTRLPRYARGKSGTVVAYYGIQECDDALPSGAIAEPQPLYSVRFEGHELWGDSAEPNSALYLDMWEMHLE